ncbi:TPA: hypothetical protein ACH3X3_004804 [Trebouxia sp. C0006]
MDGLLGRFTPKPLRKLAGSLLGIRTQQKKEATHKREASQAKHHLSSASDVLHDSRRYSETRLEQQSNKTQPSAAVQEISQTLKALRQVTADAVAAGHKLSASTHVLEVRRAATHEHDREGASSSAIRLQQQTGAGAAASE